MDYPEAGTGRLEHWIEKALRCVHEGNAFVVAEKMIELDLYSGASWQLDRTDWISLMAKALTVDLQTSMDGARYDVDDDVVLGMDAEKLFWSSVRHAIFAVLQAINFKKFMECMYSKGVSDARALVAETLDNAHATHRRIHEYRDGAVPKY